MDTLSISGLIAAMTQAAQNSAGNLVGEGKSLVNTLFFILVSYQLLLTLLGQDTTTTMINLFNSALKWGLVVFMLNEWSWVASIFNEQFNRLANLAAGSGNSTATNVVDQAMNTVKSLWGLTCTNADTSAASAIFGCQAPTAPQSEGLWDTLLNLASGSAAMYASVLLATLGLILKFIITISIVLMVVAFIVVSVMGAFMTGVGMTVGPIMIPFLLFSAVSYLFDSWLKFMITGGMIKIIAALTLVITGQLFNKLNELSGIAITPTQLGVNVMALIFMLLVSAIGTYLMWMVPAFADQLLTGAQGRMNAKQALDSKSSGLGIAKTAAIKVASKGMG